MMAFSTFAQNQYYLLIGGNIATLNVEQNKTEVINMEYTFRKKRSADFEQDVYVKNTFKDRLEGKDPQLDKAIDLILEKLK